MSDAFHRERATDKTHAWRHYFCGHCGFELDAPISCGDRFCNVCGWGPRLRARDRMSGLIAAARRLSPRPLRFVTLTTLDCHDLPDGVRAITAAFRRLRASCWWRNRVAGGIYVVEATAQPEGWHVHIHAIVQCDYLPQRSLSAKWKAITGAPIVYVQLVKNGDAPVSYLTKYLSKAACPDARRRECAVGLRGARLFSPFGSWHNIKISVPRRVCTCPSCHANDWVHDRLFSATHRWESTA